MRYGKWTYVLMAFAILCALPFGSSARAESALDAFARDSNILTFACEENADMRMLEENYGETEIAVGVSKMSANLNTTPERAERIDDSILYMTAATALAVRAQDAPSGSPSAFQSIEDLQAYFGEGSKIGVQTGTIFDQIAQKYFPKAEIVYLTYESDLIASIKSKKIDGYLVDQPQGYAQCLIDSALWMPDVKVEDDRYGLAMAFGREELRAQVNETIAKLKESGELSELAEKWFQIDEEKKKMPDYVLTGENGTLTLATTGEGYPFTYIQNGEIVGFEIELFTRICYEHGYNLEIQVSDFTGIIAAVSSGKADAALSAISITEERKERMLFSDPWYDGGMMVVLPSSLRPSEIEDPLGTRENMRKWIAGKRVGAYLGTTMDAAMEDFLSSSELVWMNGYADMSAAIASEKLDAFICEEPIAKQICKNNDGLYTSGVVFKEEQYAFALHPDNTALAEQLNATLRLLSADGTLDALRAKWCDGEAGETAMPNIELTGENGVIHIATDAADAPFGYFAHEQLVGYDYEILLLFAREHGYALEYSVIDWAALPAAVATGKCEIACGCLTSGGDRKEELLFSDTTYYGGLTFVVSAKYAPSSANGAAAEDSKTGFAGAWASISSSFERTFIRENRWKLIVQGLLTTLLISVLAAILGTVLGFGVCMARRSRAGLVSGLARAFIQLMQGTPIVVFLMILYYIVFGDVEPVLVAVIGFALNFAAYVSEMMRTGIEAVDKGQIEAASAIGFTKVQAFILITLPQAARHFLPVFKGEFISLVKMTSVVGYIAIQDLTKMSDIIRSRTYEAFFPLIATALIYFLLSWALVQSLNAIERDIDPRRKRRAIKGVREIPEKEEAAQ